MTWNVLAQCLIQRKLFPWAGEALKIKHRRKLFQDILLKTNADLLFLQEVDGYDYWEPMLKNLNYDSIYALKENGRHGCLIGFRNGKLFRQKRVLLDYSSLGEITPQTGNIGLLCELEMNSIRFICCTQHLYWIPQGSLIRLRQILTLWESIIEFNSMNLPVVFAGDFNCEPFSPEYQAITSELTKENREELLMVHEDWKYLIDSMDELIQKLSLFPKLESVNQNKEPKHTNYTEKYKGTLDYIFTDFKSIPDAVEEKTEFIPNLSFPSDHILVSATLK